MKTDNFKVRWQYDLYTPESSYLNFRKKTSCIIESHSGREITSQSVGCYYKDAPNRRVAMKESFKKAVKDIPDKSLRKELWEGFLNLSPKCVNC